MSNITLFEGSDEEKEVMAAIDEIPFGNSGFMITDLILKHPSDSRNYRQVLLEIWEKYKALKEAQFRRRRHYITRKQKQIELENEKDPLKSQLIEIDIEEQDFKISIEDKMIKDAMVELRLYHSVYKKMPKLTRAEFEASEPEHHRKKAVQQAERDVLTTGTVSQGNLEYLSHVGINPYQAQVELQHLRVSEEKRLLGEGAATEKKE